MQVNKAAMKAFLQIYYGSNHLDGDQGFFTNKKMTLWAPAADIDAVVEKVAALAESYEIWYNTSLHDKVLAKEDYLRRKPGKDDRYARGTEGTVKTVFGAFIDVDVCGPGHAQNNLPETKEIAIQFLHSLPFKVTVIIDSGGGIHAYVLLDKPFHINDDPERRRIKKLFSGIQNIVLKAGQERGWNLDPVGDLARMGRIPGTFNCKIPDNPREVQMIYSDEDIRYTAEELEKLINDNEEIVLKNKEQQIDDFENRQYYAEGIIEKCGFIQYCRDNAAMLSEPDWFAMVGTLSFCVDGSEAIHRLSESYDRYSSVETENKIEHAKETAPRTCQSIMDISGGDCCKGCHFLGHIHSPIVLGGSDESNPLEIIEKGFRDLENGSRGAYLTDEFLNACARIGMSDLPKFAEIKDRLKGHKPNLREFNNGVKRFKTKLLNSMKAREKKQTSSSTIIELSQNPSVVIPPGYRTNINGVYEVKIDDDGESLYKIANSPVILTKSFVNIADGSEMVGIANYRRGWKEFEVERDFISNSRKIVDLSKYGMPFNSNNAKAMVKYLTEFESANECNIIPVETSSKLGWQERDFQKVFLFPQNMIKPDDVEVKELFFCGSSDGERDFANSIHSRGSFEKWCETVDLCKNYPRVLFILYSSFASAMLPIFNGSNFVVDLFGRSSRGKTTALKVGASVWGKPVENSCESFLQTWDATPVQLERNAGMLVGMPLILDDTKRAKNVEDISKVIFMIHQGRGRSRGSLKGFTSTSTWRTILISSGEVPAISFSNDGGTRARTLEIGGRPFEKEDPETAMLVRKINQSLRENYGFAGPRFVEYVINNKPKWESWKTSKDEIECSLTEKSKSPIAGRLAEAMAIIISTIPVVNAAIPEIAVFPTCLDDLWPEVIEYAADANSEKAALQHVFNWAVANQETFEDRASEGRIPPQGWSGKWDKRPNWRTIDFVLGKLKDILKSGGYNPDEILSHWKDRGVLDVGTKSSRDYTKQVRLQGENSWLVCIRRSSIETMNEGEKVSNSTQEVF